MSSGFTLHLQSAALYECIEGVGSFVGQDASGSFGILPGRARFMTVLDYGLARFRLPEGTWHYPPRAQRLLENHANGIG